MPLHQGLRLLKKHRRAAGAAAVALFAALFMLLPRVMLPFMLGMVASPIVILATAVRPCPAPGL